LSITISIRITIHMTMSMMVKSVLPHQR